MSLQAAGLCRKLCYSASSQGNRHTAHGLWQVCPGSQLSEALFEDPDAAAHEGDRLHLRVDLVVTAMAQLLGKLLEQEELLRAQAHLERLPAGRLLSQRLFKWCVKAAQARPAAWSSGDY